MVFADDPVWIVREYFDYGYCTLEVTQTTLNLQVGL